MRLYPGSAYSSLNKQHYWAKLCTLLQAVCWQVMFTASMKAGQSCHIVAKVAMFTSAAAAMFYNGKQGQIDVHSSIRKSPHSLQSEACHQTQIECCLAGVLDCEMLLTQRPCWNQDDCCTQFWDISYARSGPSLTLLSTNKSKNQWNSNSTKDRQKKSGNDSWNKSESRSKAEILKSGQLWL